jgi:hypothetical protein
MITNLDISRAVIVYLEGKIVNLVDLLYWFGENSVALGCI